MCSKWGMAQICLCETQCQGEVSHHFGGAPASLLFLKRQGQSPKNKDFYSCRYPKFFGKESESVKCRFSAELEKIGKIFEMGGSVEKQIQKALGQHFYSVAVQE